MFFPPWSCLLPDLLLKMDHQSRPPHSPEGKRIAFPWCQHRHRHPHAKSSPKWHQMTPAITTFQNDSNHGSQWEQPENTQLTSVQVLLRHTQDLNMDMWCYYMLPWKTHLRWIPTKAPRSRQWNPRHHHHDQPCPLIQCFSARLMSCKQAFNFWLLVRCFALPQFDEPILASKFKFKRIACAGCLFIVCTIFPTEPKTIHSIATRAPASSLSWISEASLEGVIIFRNPILSCCFPHLVYNVDGS